jgi:hypothetical protein
VNVNKAALGEMVTLVTLITKLSWFRWVFMQSPDCWSILTKTATNLHILVKKSAYDFSHKFVFHAVIWGGGQTGIKKPLVDIWNCLHFTQNSLPVWLQYPDQSNNAVSRNEHCLLRESDDTYSHTLCVRKELRGGTLRHRWVLVGYHWWKWTKRT